MGVIAINGERYALRQLDPDPRVTAIAWRLTKSDGECYDVYLDEMGAVCCECWDFLTRRIGSDPKGCKHIAALVAKGLFLR